MLSSLKFTINYWSDNYRWHLVKDDVDIAFWWRGGVVLARPFYPNRSKLPVVAKRCFLLSTETVLLCYLKACTKLASVTSQGTPPRNILLEKEGLRQVFEGS